ncbi:MAG: fatty acid desaturase [Rhodobacteraceae bacterium]|nr:fatty acid desaturase [Paracoccaceae bacterium]MYJ86543.1 fatty acid desaturase [Paracoccaceae bacterium]
MISSSSSRIEWPTLWVMVFCYAMWGISTTILYEFSAILGFIFLTLSITLHSSLQHEVIHGHPLPNRWWSEALVFPAVGLLVPYERFRDTHLKHHYDPNLTDPYEDPETNYLDPKVWNNLARPIQRILLFNNTLSGRILIGPAISLLILTLDDFKNARSGDWSITRAWILHLVGIIPVLTWVWLVGDIPLWLYVVSAYLGFGMLKIRTYLEHRAHEQPRGRTVVVDDRGPLAFLFLNNNFHLVHHMQPEVPWYKLPKLFDADRERYLQRNEGYEYKNYLEIFRQYFFTKKDPVPHPLWKNVIKTDDDQKS